MACGLCTRVDSRVVFTYQIKARLHELRASKHPQLREMWVQSVLPRAHHAQALVTRVAPRFLHVTCTFCYTVTGTRIRLLHDETVKRVPS